MENNFKIAKFIKKDGVFEKDGYNEFRITYVKGTKPHQLSIVVNGFLTKQKINIDTRFENFRNAILLSILDYFKNGLETKNLVKKEKELTLSYFEEFYSKQVMYIIKKHIIPINKEESRDRLTKIGLLEFLIDYK